MRNVLVSLQNGVAMRVLFMAFRDDANRQVYLDQLASLGGVEVIDAGWSVVEISLFVRPIDLVVVAACAQSLHSSLRRSYKGPIVFVSSDPAYLALFKDRPGCETTSPAKLLDVVKQVLAAKATKHDR